MRRKTINITNFLIGACVGILGGILFAPARGYSVRKMLSYRVKNYVEKLQELIKVLSHNKATTSNQAKTAGQEVIEETISKAKQLLQDVNELAEQLAQ
mmetsp:Transcript_28472/g.66149  ORF Transcript_28472/g.66149 Transcript_28472/m.66149 type:complete len:98 (-) Transcript_28472:2704-2997(-)|eukprot:CAMPEP_0116850244 /NCGR_PEP_ID=MMETSP0418-20121206/16048_1 /TAXON_ID=1158023 /ORGANISM="Astrosyne radiata, Strain 13vi08-1A" /LENGTH=97 /DNA_ID=CAMNT_0004482111 /DNA_START=498 /DNA_END=791 /DNA_ORIENTATION=+